jgi:hypothetical protein
MILQIRSNSHRADLEEKNVNSQFREKTIKDLRDSIITDNQNIYYNFLYGFISINPLSECLTT